MCVRGTYPVTHFGGVRAVCHGDVSGDPHFWRCVSGYVPVTHALTHAGKAAEKCVRRYVPVTQKEVKECILRMRKDMGL